MKVHLETVDKRCGTVKDFNGFHTLTLFVRFPGKVQLARACVRFFPGLSPAHSQDELTNTIVYYSTLHWKRSKKSLNSHNSVSKSKECWISLAWRHPRNPRPVSKCAATSPSWTNGCRYQSGADKRTYAGSRDNFSMFEKHEKPNRANRCERMWIRFSPHLTPLSQADGAPQVNCFALRFTASRCSLARVAEAGDSGGILSAFSSTDAT